jgi:4-hydroxy-tetrahydrodipicolinate synthase
MRPLFKPEGVLVAPVTPFRFDGAIDYDQFGALIEHILSSGARAIIPASLTGEFFSLSLQERLDIMAFVRRVAKDAVLIASTLSVSSKETFTICRHAESLGYSALVVGAPALSAPSPNELVEYFTSLSQNVSLPIILYNFPSRLGVDLDLEVTKRLVALQNVVAYKDTSGDCARLREIASETPSLEIVCGLDELALESYAWGARAILGGAAAFIGRHHVYLWKLCVERGDFVAGRKVMKRLNPLLSIMARSSKYVQLCRYGCELAGIPVGLPRRPLLPLTGPEKDAFREAFEDLGEPELGGAADVKARG